MTRKKYAVFTMDVETFADTECISKAGIQVDVDLMDGLDEYMTILERHGIKSTLFTVGDISSKLAKRIKPYIDNGHALALHSYAHVAPMLVPVDQFREKTRQAKTRMKQLFGIDVTGFRAPCFSMDRDRLDVLQELGFTYDSSHLDFLHARNTVDMDLHDFEKLRNGIYRDHNFFEFGLAKERFFGSFLPISGGGYVRLSHWGFMKSLIHHYIRQNDYYVFYLHPFELTKKKVPLIKGLKSYDKYYIKHGIRSYAKRIEQIITMLKQQGYEFVVFEQLVHLLNTEQASSAPL